MISRNAYSREPKSSPVSQPGEPTLFIIPSFTPDSPNPNPNLTLTLTLTVTRLIQQAGSPGWMSILPTVFSSSGRSDFVCSSVRYYS